MRILNLAASTLILLAVLVLSACSITAIYPTPIITVTETQLIPFTQRVYTSELIRFGNYQELRSWLDSLEEVNNPDWTCRDYSWWLIDEAMKDGYQIVYSSIRKEAYNSVFTNLELVSPAHAITATYINGDTYLIDPQTMEVYPNGD